MVISCCLRLIIYFSVYMIGKNMKKIVGSDIMNIKIKTFMFLCAFSLLSACVVHQEQPKVNPQSTQNNIQKQTQSIPEGETEFVQSTEVAAEYKEYGERTPRDQMIVQGGAGSNVSSSIPPTIEEEVVEYEETVKTVEEENTNSEENNTQMTEDPVEDWLAEEGKTLKTLLTEWSDRAGWRLVWNSNRNYTLTAGAMFRGRYADVSSALIRAFARAKPAPIATFYKGNRVLVVETLEDENAYE